MKMFNDCSIDVLSSTHGIYGAPTCWLPLGVGCHGHDGTRGSTASWHSSRSSALSRRLLANVGGMLLGGNAVAERCAPVAAWPRWAGRRPNGRAATRSVPATQRLSPSVRTEFARRVGRPTKPVASAQSVMAKFVVDLSAHA